MTRTAPYVLAVITLMVRWLAFDNPLADLDEQFYRLVGGRMLHGALPYVAIWDRKPVGLFVLFAGFHLFGDGVLASQSAALVCVWLTALGLFRLGCRIAPPAGALAAALLYPVWLDLAGGASAQTPVFYNLLTVCAIGLLLHGQDVAAARGGNLRAVGTGAMALFGLGLQIKTSIVFEGVFCGVAFLVISRGAGRKWAALYVDAVLWIAVALAPTVFAAAVYAALGQGDAWWFANVISILHRGTERAATRHHRFVKLLTVVAPLLAPFVLLPLLRIRPLGTRADARVLVLWALAALAGVAVFGTWFRHYALPLFAPLAVLAAPLWRRRTGRIWVCGLLVVGVVLGQKAVWRQTRDDGDAVVLDAAAATARGQPGCVFVYDGPAAFYDATRSCLPTRYPFPGHLQQRIEDRADGLDQAAEVARIMRGRPRRVMTREPSYPDENPAARAALYAVLDAAYQPVFRYQSSGRAAIVVYALRGTAEDRPLQVMHPPASFLAALR
ncbi:hypothetical protein AA103196_0375 [Ameyamaea chiangmaiensis NBRC 103196]|nr:hypothetical protein AA103196_0375 [Ameyamaea chiangmaiensis NBRC 103196]